MRVAVHTKFCENLSRVSKVKMGRHRQHVMKIRRERRSGDSWILQTVKSNQTYVIYTHLPVSNTALCDSSGLWLSHTSFDWLTTRQQQPNENRTQTARPDGSSAKDGNNNEDTHRTKSQSTVYLLLGLGQILQRYAKLSEICGSARDTVSPLRNRLHWHVCIKVEAIRNTRAELRVSTLAILRNFNLDIKVSHINRWDQTHAWLR